MYSLFVPNIPGRVEMKYVLWDFDPELKYCKNISRTSRHAPSESLISYSYNTYDNENQTWALLLQWGELQWKRKSQPQRVDAVKLRALAGEEWNPIYWVGNVLENPVEAGDMASLSCGGWSSLLVKEVSQPPDKVVFPASELVLPPLRAVTSSSDGSQW